jgi:DNA replication and repair protein RecF
MSVTFLNATGFRCLETVDIEFDPGFNLLVGPNASGKTSLLESLYYLGRGRSFRPVTNRELIQTGSSGFRIFGIADGSSPSPHRLGIEVEAGRRRIRVDGQDGTGADLARCLPVQVIDPEIHELVQGGPELRRRFLDWGVFHVKHGFLAAWRDYQQALRQRNAALRQNEPDQLVRLWNEALVSHGTVVDQLRTEFLQEFLPLFSSIVSQNLSFDAICSYKSGWSAKSGFADALEENIARDRAFGATQVGPHRADLILDVADRRARYRVSRGQQKMLAAALVIAQTRYVAAQIATTPLLLVDDPAAELDRSNRECLFALLADMPAQMFITGLQADDLPWTPQARMFHVEHGRVTSLL